MEKPVSAGNFVVAAPAGVIQGGARSKRRPEIVSEGGLGFFKDAPGFSG